MNAFAEYYDMMVGADYEKITDFISSSINKFNPGSELVCDLGCGTGTVAISLAKLGYDMIGIDSSKDMLMKARENISKSGVDSILLLCQDISRFELYGTVDVIYSTLDTLNYVTDKRDLDRIFKLVKNYLNYDGLFIFDVNTEYKFNKILSGNDFIYDTEKLFCVWSSEFDKKTEHCYHMLTYFESDSDNKYVRKENFQEQRYYSRDYLEKIFEKYGFEVLKCTDDYGFSEPKHNTERITYVLKIKK